MDDFFSWGPNFKIQVYSSQTSFLCIPLVAFKVFSLLKMIETKLLDFWF